MAVLAAILVFFPLSGLRAAAPFSDNFNSYSGNLCGHGSWVANWSCATGFTGNVVSGYDKLDANSATYDHVGDYKLGDELLTGEWWFDVKIDSDSTSGYNNGPSFTHSSSGDAYDVNFDYNKSGANWNLQYNFGSTRYNTGLSLTPGVWQTLSFNWDFQTGHQFRFSLNGTYSAWFSAPYTLAVKGIRLINSVSTSHLIVYYDNFTGADPYNFINLISPVEGSGYNGLAQFVVNWQTATAKSGLIAQVCLGDTAATAENCYSYAANPYQTQIGTCFISNTQVSATSSVPYSDPGGTGWYYAQASLFPITDFNNCGAPILGEKIATSDVVHFQLNWLLPETTAPPAAATSTTTWYAAHSSDWFSTPTFLFENGTAVITQILGPVLNIANNFKSQFSFATAQTNGQTAGSAIAIFCAYIGVLTTILGNFPFLTIIMLLILVDLGVLLWNFTHKSWHIAK